MPFQLMILAVLLLLLPVCTGMFPAAKVRGYEKNVPFMWISGMLVQWAVFQAICVVFVLAETVLKREIFPAGNFVSVVWCYGISSAILAAVSAVAGRVCIRKSGKSVVVETGTAGKKKKEILLWGVFALLLAAQLFLMAFLAFADGDDAYYVASSVIMEESNTLYEKLPYTGGSTGVDIRHGMAPFPVWISFLARVSGMHAAAVSHLILPLVLLPMTYALYGLIGREVCRGKKEMLPVYMIFVSLLILWGNYSLYTAETFLMTRTRQGKAALGNIVLPMALWLLIRAGEQLQQKKKVETIYWALLFSTVTAACLCSTLGTFLMLVFMGFWGLCQIWCNRCFRILLPLAVCAAPAAVYLGIFLCLR